MHLENLLGRDRKVEKGLFRVFLSMMVVEPTVVGYSSNLPGRVQTFTLILGEKKTPPPQFSTSTNPPKIKMPAPTALAKVPEPPVQVVTQQAPSILPFPLIEK